VMGYYGARSHRIVSLPDMDCMLSNRVNKAILEAVKGYMMDGNIPAYDEESGKGLIRHVLIREGKATGEIMVCLVINGAKLPNQAALVEALSGIESVTSICVNCNTRRDNVILGEKTYAIFGEDYITDSITLTDGQGHVLEPISFQISANSFYQVNHDQMEKLYSIAIDYADLSGNESVWDLYCGIGTISLSMARKAGTVYGVEIVPQAIENAKNNARLNNISNAQFFVGKAEEVLPDFYQGKIKTSSVSDSSMLTPDVIVVDPPRKGCDEACLNTMVAMAPERIVYVSCDSATLARDLKYLCANGYELKKVQAFDQFAHTMHVETVVLLSKGVVDKDNFRKVKVDFSLEDMDLTELRGKATYAQVKEYILNEFGLKVSSLYIAQVKKKCGIETGENHNLPKSEDARQPQVTPEKEAAIMKAFKHFGVI